MTSEHPRFSPQQSAAPRPAVPRPAVPQAVPFWKLPVWVAGCLLSAAVLSVTAAYAPTVMKRLILFPLVYGVACGFVFHWLLHELELRWSRLVLALALVIGCLGTVNVGILSFHQFQRARHEQARQNPKDLEMLETIRQASQNDSELQAEYAKELQYYTPGFREYLQHRVSILGNWPEPWPALFWGLEVVLAGCGTAGMMQRLERNRNRTAV